MTAAQQPKAAPIPSAAPPAALTVDLGAIAENYNLVRRTVGPSCVASAVVKADSYGLGMAPVVAALENQDCPLYIVATPDEALALRPLTAKPILALGGTFGTAADDYIRHNITPALNSLEAIADWRNAARRHGIRLPAALHFDTGMNRLGLATRETAALLDDPAALDGLDVTLVMSHFACADEAGHPLNKQQYERFAVIAARFPKARKSLANSSGTFRDPAWHFDMVRPGQALYGLNPTPEAPNPVRPAVSLEARILQVKTALKGETVGYGASHKLNKDTVVATTALGYADGIFRSLGNKGTLYHQGRACPVIGRISMDYVTVDLGTAPARPGDMLEVLGPHQSADDLASSAGTIGYEILTALGGRYRRIYKG